MHYTVIYWMADPLVVLVTSTFTTVLYGLERNTAYLTMHLV